MYKIIGLIKLIGIFIWFSPAALAQNGVINALDLGFVADDSEFDNSTIIAELNQLSTRRTVYFPSGSYFFKSEPPSIQRNLTLFGDSGGTTFIKLFPSNNYNSALLKVEAEVHISNLNILVDASPEFHGGSAIHLNGLDASNSKLENLYITGTPCYSNQPSGQNSAPYQNCSSTDFGLWDIPLRVEGAPFDNDPSTADGIRGLYLEDIALFNARIHLAWFLNPQGITAIDLNAYKGKGNVSHITIQGTSATQRGNDVHILSTYLPVTYVYWTDWVTVRGLRDTQFLGDFDPSKTINK